MENKTMQLISKYFHKQNLNFIYTIIDNKIKIVVFLKNN